MEPEINRETAQQADSLLRDAINNDREALDELLAVTGADSTTGHYG